LVLCIVEQLPEDPDDWVGWDDDEWYEDDKDLYYEQKVQDKDSEDSEDAEGLGEGLYDEEDSEDEEGSEDEEEVVVTAAAVPKGQEQPVQENPVQQQQPVQQQPQQKGQQTAQQQTQQKAHQLQQKQQAERKKKIRPPRVWESNAEAIIKVVDIDAHPDFKVDEHGKKVTEEDSEDEEEEVVDKTTYIALPNLSSLNPSEAAHQILSTSNGIAMPLQNRLNEIFSKATSL
jgi:hypothetical protein